MATSKNSFSTRTSLKVEGKEYQIFSLAVLEKAGYKNIAKLPFSLKVMLENLLRHEDGQSVSKNHIETLAQWNPAAAPDSAKEQRPELNKQFNADAARHFEAAEDNSPVPYEHDGSARSREISFMPARVLLQDFTGVPSVVDLAAMREAMRKMGGDPKKINPLLPAELVIDHSVQVDKFGTADSFAFNAELEFQRNVERYQFLRWGQKAFQDFKVVPPDTGIVHQVNLEYLARVVFTAEHDGAWFAYPDTLVGTDSHTTMINGLGVVGWGVGGIEAEAAMLGLPLSMLIPDVVGFKLSGKLPEGSTATDLVLTVTEMLRTKGVVGKFVEFYGAGLSSLSLPDRATIGNMSPEYGATIGFFPIDAETLAYLKFTGRDEALVKLVEKYAKEQGIFRTDSTPDPVFTDKLELDLATVEPTVAGPKRPQDRVLLKNAKAVFAKAVESLPVKAVTARNNGDEFELRHGAVVIAAITSCTNTSNPSLMIGAGLLAKKALEHGLRTKPWVKTSLAPGSKVVSDYLNASGLTEALEAQRFHLVGYGCTTCIGNSGPLPKAIGEAIEQNGLVAVSVLSGNRNFEGRIHPLVRANYLASPPLVVAYALAGRMDVDLVNEPLGTDPVGKKVFLRDIWPTPKEVEETMRKAVTTESFRKQYGDVFEGDERWKGLEVPEGDLFKWDEKSTYIQHPPYFVDMPAEPAAVAEIRGARVLAMLGDSITTDHISPAGSIKPDSPAGKYLIGLGVKPADFNSYGSRRGNHEVMVRGTFANVRLRNEIA
ncbi:MAG TPA: aconitate hydratase AcnA, partial [Candidatus Acidoferrales bacterium]|nr:aconitate hydratase AcnA [Candidatus Acidoferrales bacterium]